MRVGLCWALVSHMAWGFESVRSQEIAQCLPGEVSTWADGLDRTALANPMVFVYDHTNAPAWFSQALVVSTLQKAQQAWSQCGVPGRIVTASHAKPYQEELRKGALLVQWSDAASPGSFGQVDPMQRTLSLGPAAFALLPKINPSADAREMLQTIISHEMGHTYGLLAHSRRCVDVTSIYSNGKGERCTVRYGLPMPPSVEYRSSMPTACDIQRCVAANKQ
jgi:hypothetical protein